MHAESAGVLLRIHVGESDTRDGRAVYRVIVEEARRRNLAGATVLRGMMGYGAGSRIHTSRFLRLSEDLPVVVEIVDTEEQVQTFLPFLDEIVREGLVTMERVRVIQYRDDAD